MFDFRWTLLAASVWFTLDFAFQKAIYPVFVPYCKEQSDLVSRHNRSIKAAKNVFKTLYYSCANGLAWHLLKDNHVLPPMLGGSGSFYNQWKDFPYIRHPPLYQLYYMGTMGFHLSQLFQQIFFESWDKSDFLEMLLHHGVTVYLYGFSYMTNMWIGVPVAFLHNLGDLCVAITRFWSETRVKPVTAVWLVTAVIVWFYTRIYVFPQLIWASCVDLEIYLAVPVLIPLFGGLMTCLFLLHIYWFILMMRILATAFLKGKLEDTVNINSRKTESTKT